MGFKVGQIVVCIDPIDDLVKNDIYTIESIGESIFGENGLILKEIKSIGYLGGFLSSRFRPLVEVGFAEELLSRLKEEAKEELLIQTK